MKHLQAVVSKMVKFCTFFRNALIALFFETPHFQTKKLHVFSKRLFCTNFRNAPFAPFFETHYIILHLFSKRPPTTYNMPRGLLDLECYNQHKIYMDNGYYKCTWRLFIFYPSASPQSSSNSSCILKTIGAAQFSSSQRPSSFRVGQQWLWLILKDMTHFISLQTAFFPNVKSQTETGDPSRRPNTQWSLQMVWFLINHIINIHIYNESMRPQWLGTEICCCFLFLLLILLYNEMNINSFYLPFCILWGLEVIIEYLVCGPRNIGRVLFEI